MKTALEKLESAIADDLAGTRGLESFMFQFAGYLFDYQGRFYAYVSPIDKPQYARFMDEYCWSDYNEMLCAKITQTGKTVRQMLTELPEHDLEIVFDVSYPPNAVVIEEP